MSASELSQDKSQGDIGSPTRTTDVTLRVPATASQVAGTTTAYTTSSWPWPPVRVPDNQQTTFPRLNEPTQSAPVPPSAGAYEQWPPAPSVPHHSTQTLPPLRSAVPVGILPTWPPTALPPLSLAHQIAPQPLATQPVRSREDAGRTMARDRGSVSGRRRKSALCEVKYDPYFVKSLVSTYWTGPDRHCSRRSATYDNLPESLNWCSTHHGNGMAFFQLITGRDPYKRWVGLTTEERVTVLRKCITVVFRDKERYWRRQPNQPHDLAFEQEQALGDTAALTRAAEERRYPDLSKLPWVPASWISRSLMFSQSTPAETTDGLLQPARANGRPAGTDPDGHDGDAGIGGDNVSDGPEPNVEA